MKITPSEIMRGMSEKNRLLSQKNDEYIELSEKCAECERSYNIALAQKITQLKINGQPATLIPTLAKGDKGVADLKFEYDVSEGMRRACLNVLANLRSQVDSYRSLLSWLKAELQSQ
jgi:hypothetical protein